MLRVDSIALPTPRFGAGFRYNGRTPDSSTAMRHSTNRILIAIGALFAVVGVFAAQWIVPRFAEVFANFGAELPALTRIFVHGRMFLWSLPLLVPIAAALVRPRGDDDTRPGVVALLIGIALGVLLPVICLSAMYLPIFGLASSVE